MRRTPRIEAKHPDTVRFARFSGRYNQMLRDGLTENAASFCIKYARAHCHDLSAVVGCAERVLENHPEVSQRMERFLTACVWREPGGLEVQAIRLRFLGRDEPAEKLERFQQEVEALIELNMMAEASRICLMRDCDPEYQREVLGFAASVVTLAEKEQVREALLQFEQYVRENPGDHGMRQRYGVLLFAAGEASRAVEEFARVPIWALNPAESWMGLEAFCKSGKPEAVRRWFEVEWPRRARWLKRVAFGYYLKFLWTACCHWVEQGRLDLADRGYRVLRYWDATCTVWLLEHGRVLRTLGLQEAAKDAFRAGLTVQPAEVDNQFLYPHAVSFAAEEERRHHQSLAKELAATC
ncbi:MAG: tetratricopeptide repeat protein [Terrimicrobiaceae bacterium]